MELQIALVLCGILAFALILMIRNNSNLQTSNTYLRDEITRLTTEVSKTKKDKEELISIDPGDKAIIPDYGLVYGSGTSNEVTFKITYEVEIIEVSMDKVKVKAIDFVANDSTGRDPSNRKGILDFMKDKWISKRQIELVVDNSMRRDAKLQEILGDK